MPYPDASFDAVVAVFLLWHLSDPLAALKEMRRVLRPGGIAGLHDGEQSMWFFVPENPLLIERNDIVCRVQELNGGMPIYARHQRSLLLEAGFARAEQAASAATAIEQGWIDQPRADEVVVAVHEWSARPDAMSFKVTFQAVGFVE